ncbi:tRNA wybutosine-synthesizing protein 4-like [Mercenaria mercenaria]|uniref:tRNA wybutosine-synthesizing protein 4-like n=1 Tax=Mercenaria mercenaria TaxID=6596 RepID=UPI00234EAC5A|nr:tRNA wybutosine-synthesizing protein 4-like [Mercenaria mercenaria]
MENDKRSKTSKSRRETAVQGTNDSSIVSKCSMSLQGYFDDPYLQGFVSKVTRRAPLIHRGYYIRAQTIDYILNKFLESNPGDKQIISLGAGFDSAYFRLKAQNLLQGTVFFEVDFPEVVKRKHALIDSNPEMLALVGESCSLIHEKSPHIEISTSSYKLLGADLSQTNILEAALKLCDIDFDCPTLLMSECVLTYMTRRTASGVVKWANETVVNSVFVLYEQINPTDAFGLFMQHHFQIVGSPLKCINFFPIIQSQKDRFSQLGWRDLEVLDMNEFYNNLLSRDERDRVEKLEMFDEYEEWHLKCAHYMVLLGYHGNCSQLLTGMVPQKDNTMKVVKEYKGMVEVSSCDSKQLIRRFGHATARWGTSLAVCIGGFGEQAGKHMRVTDIVLIDMDTLKVKVINPNVDNRTFEVSRMHATLSSLKDGRLILIGGRLSPMRLCTQMVSIDLNSGKENLNQYQYAVCMNCGRNEAKLNEVKSDYMEENMNSLKSNNAAIDKSLSEENLCMNCSRMNISSVKKCVMNSCSEGKENSENKENFVKNDDKIGNVQLNSEAGSDISKPVIIGACDTDRDSGVPSAERSLSENDETVIIAVIEQNGDLPSSRWRHTAVVYEENGAESVIVYGGRSQNILALGDCYMFMPHTYTWSKVETSGKAPEPRQSHSACIWNKHMVVAGGLNADLQPLTSVHLLNLETNMWSELNCGINPRYSHTAHVIEDILILIGGVSFSHDPPGVAMIHLPSGTSAEFALPAANKDNLLMLHRHTTVVMDDHRILLLGGGGNCFSFGTHLNSSPVILDFSESLKTVK